MGISAHLPAGAVRTLVETHPQLARLRARLAGDLHIDPSRAARLVASLVTHAVEDLADAFLGEASARLRRIESIRSQIAGAVDHVVAEGALPPGLDQVAVSRLFDNLQREMAGLQSVRRFAHTHSTDPDIDAILGGIRESAPPTAASRPFAPTGDPLQGVVGPRPPGMLRDAMAALDRNHPARAALFRRVLENHGDHLGLAVLADTESAQAAALRELRDLLGPGFPEADFNEIRAAVEDLGRARGRALQGPGTAAARVRAERIADLPPELRSAIGGDNTLLGPLAEQHPEDLHELWDAWVAGGRKGGRDGFRAYVRGEMASERRPALAEWQAAFDLADQYGIGLLKDPAAFDPAAPGGRRVNPREPGTDLIGLREDGEIWYVDDKSHRLSPSDRAAGQTGINLSGVSAFEDRLPINMADDVAEMEAAFSRMTALGHSPDPRAVEAAARLRRCSEQLAKETAGWTPDDLVLPANQTRVRAILDANRVRLKVTSTMGDVTGMTARLQGLGIEVLPPIAPNPIRARLP